MPPGRRSYPDAMEDRSRPTWRQGTWFRLRRTHLVCGLHGHRPEVMLTRYSTPFAEREVRVHTVPDGRAVRCWCGRRRKTVMG